MIIALYRHSQSLYFCSTNEGLNVYHVTCTNMLLSACHVIARKFLFRFATILGRLIFLFFEVHIPMIYFRTIIPFFISCLSQGHPILWPALAILSYSGTFSGPNWSKSIIKI